MRIRLDQLLVKKLLAPSRTKAQDLIRSGEVEITVEGEVKTPLDPGLKVSPETEVRVREGGNTLKYVSRAGLKLESALRQTGLNVAGKICLDVGQSTGGFTDLLLQQGASEVWGLDVGRDQLHPSLRDNHRVRFFEELDVREARNHPKLQNKKFDMAVVDISFISLEKVIDEIYYFLKEGAEALLLIKPQFELERKALNKHGLVKDPSRIPEIKEKLRRKLMETGFVVKEFFPSEVKGKDGNQEYFFHVVKN